ncbi:MAG: right-handed parallel beta-helix repeat-containing protein [Candidatus Eisenbacteria bacterium]|nr:right-handed parallel beta-helix repeat-containing protein [Candidatus Eisenbacteria bacterium]
MSRIRFSSGLGLFVLMGALPVGSSLATTYVVHPDGSGDLPTIQAAVNIATDGDVIELTDGIFRGAGNRAVSFLGKGITIRSQSGDPAECVIDCEGSAKGFLFTSSEGQSSVLESVTITHGFTSDYGGAIDIRSSSPRISRCVFRENFSGYTGGALSCLDYSGPVIEECEFYGNSVGPGLPGGAIYSGRYSEPTLSGCVLANNSAFVHGGGFHCHTGSSATVTGCTFVDNSAPQGSQVSIVNGASVRVERTILAFGGVGSAVYCVEGTSVSVSCSDVYGNEGGDWVGCIEGEQGTDDNFTADPLFCNRPDGNYQLFVGSPCSALNSPCQDLVGALDVGCGGPFGACCLTDGDCVYTSPDGCGDLGGEYMGESAPCEPNPCPGAGACCFPDGFCSLLTEAACIDSGGTLLGVEVPCAPHPCGPVTVFPDGGGHFETVQQAIDTIGDGGIVQLAAGVFTGVGNKNLDFRGKRMTLRSLAGDPGECILDCEGDGRGLVFDDNEGHETSVSGITIRRGATDGNGGGVACLDASPTLENLVIRECSAIAGGGLFLNESGAVLTDCRLLGNSATDGGGAYVSGSFPEWTRCVVTGNGPGSGIACVSSAMSFESTTIAGNRSTGLGGGLLLSGASGAPSWVTVERCILAGNCAVAGEDVFLLDSYTGITVVCSAVNQQRISGFGIVDYAGEQVFEDPLFCSPGACEEAPTLGGSYTLMADSPCLEENSPCGELIGALAEGCTASGVAEDLAWQTPGGTDRLLLHPPLPNPVADRITVRLELSETSRARVGVYDVAGREVAILLDQDLRRGAHALQWQPRGADGGRLACGIYFLKAVVGKESTTRTFVVAR